MKYAYAVGSFTFRAVHADWITTDHAFESPDAFPSRGWPRTGLNTGLEPGGYRHVRRTRGWPGIRTREPDALTQARPEAQAPGERGRLQDGAPTALGYLGAERGRSGERPTSCTSSSRVITRPSSAAVTASVRRSSSSIVIPKYFCHHAGFRNR